MKTTNILTSIVSLAAAIAVTACSTEDIDRFDTSREALNIGFGSASNLTQTSTYNYSETTNERAVTFYARITGRPADHDRSFTLEAADGDLSLAAGSYRVETYVIPAGEISGEYSIYFNPAGLSDPNAFSTEDGEIVFRVAPNDSFSTGALNENELIFTLKNSLSMPEEWNSATYPYRAISGYFGVYSPEKFRFMIENGCPVNFRINYNQSTPTTESDGITILGHNYANYLKQVFQLALSEYNDTHDTPLTDSLGNLITF